MKNQLALLAASVDTTDEILSRAERSGMEVSQARLDLTQARDALMKARVTVHSFNAARVEADIKPGLDASAKEYDAGKRAMAERNYRRVGLGISLVAIFMVLLGLRLYIKRIES